jgi:hypothetical protein
MVPYLKSNVLMLCLIINNYFKVRKPTNIRRSRAKVSPADVRTFFEKIQPNLEGVPPNCIFNYDESPFRDDPGAEAAFFALRTRHCEQVQNHSKTSFSVMFCCSAAGDLVPPMTVYKSVTGGFYKMWGEGGPPGSTYTANKSGYFDMDKFTKWFTDVFLPYIATLPADQVKVLIGDNLAAHMSPTVTRLCEENNIRFIFLPENSTHLLQPLDVAVFAPMKRKWREVLTTWKEDCIRVGENYASIPKQSFPALLGKLLEKDWGGPIRSGFAATGLYPFSLERVLAKLPKEINSAEIETAVQKTLLNKLNDMRHNLPATKQAPRPKKKDKLPAGATYTCPAQPASDTSDEDEEELEEPLAVTKKRSLTSMLKGSHEDSDSSNYSNVASDSDEASDRDEASSGGDSDSEREEARRGLVNDLVERLDKNKDLDEEEDEPVDPYPPKSFVVAIYQGEDWYVGQVLDKDEEPEAEKGENYLYVTFMEKIKGDLLKWPRKPDVLNMLKDDILFPCQTPAPCAATSSTRVNSFTLSKGELKKAKQMFLQKKAYYPTLKLVTVTGSTVKFGRMQVCVMWVSVWVRERRYRNKL